MTVHTPYLSCDTDLARYVAEIQKFPVLSQSEENRLARRYHAHGDLQAAHSLVTSHLRMVVRVALSYRGYGLPVVDLISEGNIGVMKAVKKFDPDKGFRLSTYAMWWIKASIQEFVLKSWSLVKVGTTAAQKKLFFNLRRLKNKMKVFDDRQLSGDEAQNVADTLDVTVSDVRTMEGRMGGDQSLNAPITHDDTTAERVDYLEDEHARHDVAYHNDQEHTIRRGLLHQALNALKDRERAIFTARKLEDPPQTLEDLSQQHGISRERVRQIENQALNKIQNMLKTQK